MILSRDLKKTKAEKAKPNESVSTSKSRADVDAILSIKQSRPPGYTRTEPLKKPMTLPDTEKPQKQAEPEENEALKSPLSDELKEGKGMVSVPWLNSFGEFQMLKIDAYRALPNDEKKLYSAAKKKAE